MIRHMFRNIGEGKLHYEVRGEGRPILMLHGFSLDSAVMLGCMEPLFSFKKGWKRIYVDLPGMGGSPRIPGVNDSDEMLDVMVRFVDSILPEQSFAIAGESYGGYLAHGLLRERMESVKGMLLICPLVFASPSKRELPHKKVLVQEEGILDRAGKAAQGFSDIGVVLSQDTLDRYWKDVMPGKTSGDQQFQQQLFENGYAFSFDVDEISHPFHHPALVLAGRQDHVVGYRDAWKLLEKYPRGTFAVLDRSGHNLQFEQVGLFDALVSEWLDRVDEAWNAPESRRN